MNTSIVASIAALLLIVGGVIYYNYGYPQGEVMMNKGALEMSKGEDLMNKGEDMKEDGEAMMKKGESMMKDEVSKVVDVGTTGTRSGYSTYSGAVLAGTASPFLDFNKNDYDTALASGKPILLYFYANWCPVCKAELPNAVSAFNTTQTDGVIGFRVNYNDSDTDADEKALAKEFGVAYQHTKVLLKGGKKILKSPESWDMARYQTELTTISQ